ncbi:hypothetical protein MLD38_003797 [Melastoma candidum]|uniref:Uncharacterized protein n=1 Tax=Melastoma candidum TaxID=119954 RepID=A0ACB9S7K6_9MYRT|nr:hypothetical protein MLD38_003797 [Melastoma candidum]
MDPIDISSSDSDFDWEDDDEIDAERTFRFLPSWASTSGVRKSTDHGGPSQSYTSAKVDAASGSSLSPSPMGKANGNTYPKDRFGASSQGSDGSAFNSFRQTDRFGQSPVVKSHISNSGVGNFERISSENAPKKALPPSFQSPEHRNRTVVDVEDPRNGGAHGSSYQSSFSYSTNGRSNIEENSNRNANNQLVTYESKTSRILPPYMMAGKPLSNEQFGSLSDFLHRPGIGDERINKEDERLIYQAALEDLNPPEVEARLHEGLMSVQLLRHQRIALAWMIQKETRSLHCLGGILADDQGLGKTISMIALMLMERSPQTKSKAEETVDSKTEALNLDEDDEIGAGESKMPNGTEHSEVSPNVPTTSASNRAFSRRRPAAGTLVVCPASVLRQWNREIDEKVTKSSKLSVLVYHGGNRTKDPIDLASYDVVLTTYAIVTIEVPKQPLVDEDGVEENNVESYGISSEFSSSKRRKKASYSSKKGKKGRKGIEGSFDNNGGALARVGWFRVILDEAQTIKNHRTQVARACCSLRAKRRWCLSGTPIQNTIDDLYSYFRFLKYEPYAVYKSFYQTIKVPISRNSLHGYKKLQAILRAVMLRRTKETLIKGEPIIQLPPKLVRLAQVDFSAEERDFYGALESDSRRKFKAFHIAGTLKQNYANILLLLLRLRQACDHPMLCKGHVSDSVEKIALDAAKKLSKEKLINLLKLLEFSSPVCGICNDSAEDPFVTICEHVFCETCVLEYVEGDDNTCPAPRCREQLRRDNVFSKYTLRSCLNESVDGSSTSSHDIDKSSLMQHGFTSAKIKAVLEILRAHCLGNIDDVEIHRDTERDMDASSDCEIMEVSASGVKAAKHTTVYSSPPNEGPVKAIIFSQWTGMLDLVENSLNQNLIQYRRLDGRMSLAARDRAVKDFNSDPEVLVMLMSLKAGNLGLNMVAASHVVLLDLWWNPTTEDQAVDRAHRIGQTRPVTVTRITIKDTVEDRILSLQEEKRKMVASAFGEDQGGASTSKLTVDDLKYLFMI